MRQHLFLLSVPFLGRSLQKNIRLLVVVTDAEQLAQTDDFVRVERRPAVDFLGKRILRYYLFLLLFRRLKPPVIEISSLRDFSGLRPLSLSRRLIIATETNWR